MARRGRKRKPTQPPVAPPLPPEQNRPPTRASRPPRRLLAIAAAAAVLGALGLWVSRRSAAPPDPPASASASAAASASPIGGDPDYIEPAACAGCHAEIAADFAQTGMGRSFYRATTATMDDHLDAPASYRHEASGRSYAIIERDGEYFLRRHQPGADGRQENVVEARIDYVMGSGNHARSYLHHRPDGAIVELPLGWYAENGGSLAMSPGYDQPTHKGFRREIGFDCMFCHNGYPRLRPGADAVGRDPLYEPGLPSGIDCQRCHGPGRRHVEAVADGASEAEIRAAVFNPASVGRERQLEVCMQCHLESTSRRLPYAMRRFDRAAFSYRPSEPLPDYVLHFDHPAGVREEKFEIAHAAYRLRKSQCFERSEMTCTTCHDPHRARRGEEAQTHQAGVCRSCHQADLAAAATHPSGDDCAACHMPARRTDDVVRVVMTDHYIQRRPPAGDLLAPKAETSESEDERYRGEVAAYYPADLDDPLYLAVAQVYEETNLAAGIPRLTEVVERLKPEDPAFHFYLAEAHWAADRLEAALDVYRAAWRRDPSRPIFGRNYGYALARLGRFAEAENVLRAVLDEVPEDPKTLVNLADVLIKTGRPSEAAVAARAALSGDPGSPEAHQNLALALADLGRPQEAAAAARDALRHRPDYPAGLNTLGRLLLDAGAREESERSFREALRLHPDHAQARYNLATLLAETKRLEEAERELREAVRIDPKFVAAYNNLGNLAAVRGRLAEAERRFRRTVELAPEFFDGRLNLGTVLAQSGRVEEALPHFREALRLEPDSDQARLNLGAALATIGEVDPGREHLERAARSSNPQIAEAARQALRSLAVP